MKMELITQRKLWTLPSEIQHWPNNPAGVKLASSCQQGKNMKFALSYLTPTAWTQGYISTNPYIPVIVAVSANFYPTNTGCVATAHRYVLTESSWNKNKLPEEEKKVFILQAFLNRDKMSWILRVLKYYNAAIHLRSRRLWWKLGVLLCLILKR